MDAFSVRDLREHTGDLIHDAESGKLSLITKHGHPVFIAVPFTQDLIELGLRPMLAVHLYQQEILPLAKAARLGSMSLEEFIVLLSKLGVSPVRYSIKEVDKELKDFK